MDSLKALLKLELISRYGSINYKDKNYLIKLFLVLIFSILIYSVYIIGARSFIISFYIYDMEFLFLVLFIALLNSLIFFMGVSTIIKSLFMSGDNEILLRFPVKGREVFISKILFTLILQTIVTIVAMLPVLIIYGRVLSYGFAYYFAIAFVIAFSVIIPFALANIFAIPIMYIKAFLQDKHAVVLALLITFIGLGFAIYMISVQGLLVFMEEQSMNFFSDRFMIILSTLINYLVPMRQIANILVGNNVMISLVVIIAFIALLLFVAYRIVDKLYLKTMLRNLESSNSTIYKHGRDRMRSVSLALFIREFLEIFRSSNYAFQYLAMAFAAPVMVYYCNKLASFVGQTNIGSNVIPALTMLVMLIFITLTVSFSSSSISREGGNFYLTKITPIRYTQQVMVKYALYMLVALSSITISFVAVTVGKFIDIKLAFIMATTCIMYAVGLTSLSIKLDILRPQFAIGGDGEIVSGTPNTFIILFLGLCLAVVNGIYGIVMSFFWGVDNTIFTILGFAVVFALTLTIWLFYKLEYHYSRIM